ncbi:g6401 [Coccomyxa elongata]
MTSQAWVSSFQGHQLAFKAPHGTPSSKRTTAVTTCGSKKKKMAEARLKAGRKRLADVILELQGSPSFDATILQQRLQEVDGVLCGENEFCMSSSSSSSSESEDEDMKGMTSGAPLMQKCREATVPEARSSNVVPMNAKLKNGTAVPAKEDALEVLKSLPSGATVRVCQGKACVKRGSAQLLADMSTHVEEGIELVPCKCLDKCKSGPNIEVSFDAEKRIVAVHSPAQKILAALP